MLEHGAVCRAYDSWAEVVGLREGDRYLIINPFFHSFGLQGRLARLPARGAPRTPRMPVFDVPQRAGPHRSRAHQRASRAADDLPEHPRPSRASTRSTCRSLRLAVTGAAAMPVGADPRMRDGARLRDDRDRLRPHRVDRHRHRCAAHDDDPETDRQHLRAARSPTSRCAVVDDDGDEVPAGRAGRDRGARLQRDARLLRATRRRPRRRSTPTAGCTPATSA